MSDRIPSDHAAVESHRVHLSTVGRTRRYQIPLPAGVDCDTDDVVFLSLESEGCYSQVAASLDGEPTIQTAFRTRHAARTQEGDDQLREWVERHDLNRGDALVLDVLRAEYAYGLRRPGERVVYSPPDPPNSSLSDIAQNLDS